MAAARKVRPLDPKVKRDRRIGLKRLLRLADGLEKVPQPAFDYGEIMAVPKDGGKAPLEALKAGGGCGTAGCAIGWGPSILPKVLAWRSNGGYGMRTDDRGGLTKTMRVCLRGQSGLSSYTSVGQHAFALTYDEADYLFTPGMGHPRDGRRVAPPDGASAKRVARHIRRFAEAELRRLG